MDANDLLRAKGVDALRAAFDNSAKPTTNPLLDVNTTHRDETAPSNVDAAESSVHDISTGTVKPRLHVEPTSPDETVVKIRDVLAERGDLYDRGVVVRVAHEQTRGSIVVHALLPDDLILRVHECCRPYHFKTDRKGAFIEENCRLPRYMASMYLGWRGKWGLKPLNGIACSPLLREDGSFYATDGYDALTGLYCERIPDVSDLVPATPTRQDAARALRQLRSAFRTICFADASMGYDDAAGVDVVDLDQSPGADESACIAALLTAVCRASLPLAPGVVVRAAALSGAGSGKGLLVRCISVIAYGREPNAVSGAANREELEKQISAELIEASPVLFLDNLNGRTFRSDLLASAMTERPARVRILGKSQMGLLNSSALVALTGNGLSVTEDLARRFIFVELDPRTEDPEARPFKTDMKAICRDNRRGLLAAAITIFRWGRLNSEALPNGMPIGSFEMWGRWVRDPLVALGCQDPVARIGETKSRDPRRAELAELFQIWLHHHGHSSVAARDLDERVRELIAPVNSSRQYIARKLESLSGTRAAGLILVRQLPAGRHGVAAYAMKNADEVDRHRGHQGHTTPSAPDDPDDPYASGSRGEDTHASSEAAE